MELVIDLRDGGDWSLDLCFAGLRQNLGAERVIDIPRKKKHREWAGVVQGFIEPDWGLERRTLGYFPKDYDPGTFPLTDITRVWLDERMESFQEYRRLGLYDAKVPVVVVAGHDRFWNQSPQFVASLYGERLQGMLLDNWYPEYANLPFPTRRIGWSCNFDHYWSRPNEKPQKDIDIFFIGYNSHPDRARYVNHVIENWPNLNNHIFLETEPDSFKNFIPKERMFNLMLRSKICLNLRGAADRGKTLRAYEIPYVGSYMLTQDIEDPGMVIDFNPAVHADYFGNERELNSLIRIAIEDPARRERIASAGHDRALSNLSVRRRWADVVQWLDDVSRSRQQTVRRDRNP